MISEADIKRRDRLLGMLTSQFDGERATAGSMLAKLAAQHKMTVPEFCKAAGGQPKPEKQPQQSQDSLLKTLDQVLVRRSHRLTTWETNFLEDIVRNYSSDRLLSEKQRKVIFRILKKTAI